MPIVQQPTPNTGGQQLPPNEEAVLPMMTWDLHSLRNDLNRARARLG
jgi:hypothetical protein